MVEPQALMPTKGWPWMSTHSPMPHCCIESLARKGIRENFTLAKEGEQHACETCGRRYELKLTWRLLPGD